MTEEIWKDCSLNENYHYEVSNLGHFKGPKGIIKGSINNGYIRVSRSYEKGKSKKDYLHQIVLKTFCPLEDYTDMTVNHKNGDHFNNTLDNLEWLTKSDNSKHARYVLGYNSGVPVYSINKDTGEKIFFDNICKCAEYYGCDEVNIRVNYNNNNHLWKKYNIYIYQVNNEPEIQEDLRPYIERGTQIYCITTDEYFKSMAEASRKYNIPASNICKCCKGERESAGRNPETNEKMIWKYA